MLVSKTEELSKEMDSLRDINRQLSEEVKLAKEAATESANNSRSDECLFSNPQVSTLSLKSMKLQCMSQLSTV